MKEKMLRVLKSTVSNLKGSTGSVQPCGIEIGPN